MPLSRYSSKQWSRSLVFGGSSPNTFYSNFYRFSDYNRYIPQNNQLANIDFPLVNNQVGVYSGSLQSPGGRDVSSSFISNNKFYVFGGYGRGAFVNGVSSLGHLNDLWRYDGRDLLTNKLIWSWIKGDSTINNASVYGRKGLANSSNKPGARGHAMLRGAGGSQYIFFGGSSQVGDLNYLWSYDSKQMNGLG